MKLPPLAAAIDGFATGEGANRAFSPGVIFQSEVFMRTLSTARLHRCVIGLILTFTATLPVAGEEETQQEMRYLFAGMLQERGKLKSFSCSINGVEPNNNYFFEMKLLSKGKSIRFTRTSHHPESKGVVLEPQDMKDGVRGFPKAEIRVPRRDEVLRACYNDQMTVYYNVADKQCMIHKPTFDHRERVIVWDPRTACLVLDHNETDYETVLNNRLEYWRDSSTTGHKDSLWTVVYTKSHEFFDARLSITIDTEHGFTPVHYHGESLFKPNSKHPGKKQVSYDVTAKWELLTGVWVPVYHRQVDGNGKVVREYKVSWDWTNQDVDDKEFTIDALGLPGDVQKIYFDEKGEGANRQMFVPADVNNGLGGRAWLRWAVYALGFFLIAIALVKYRLRGASK